MEQRQDITLTETWVLKPTETPTVESVEIWQPTSTIAEIFGENTHIYTDVSCRNTAGPEDNKTTRK